MYVRLVTAKVNNKSFEISSTPRHSTLRFLFVGQAVEWDKTIISRFPYYFLSSSLQYFSSTLLYVSSSVCYHLLLFSRLIYPLLSLLYSSVLFSSVSSSYLIFSPTFNPNFLSTCPSLSFSLLLSLSTSLPHYLTQNYPHFLFVSLVPVPRPSSK